MVTFSLEVLFRNGKVIKILLEEDGVKDKILNIYKSMVNNKSGVFFIKDLDGKIYMFYLNDICCMTFSPIHIKSKGVRGRRSKSDRVGLKKDVVLSDNKDKGSVELKSSVVSVSDKSSNGVDIEVEKGSTGGDSSLSDKDVVVDSEVSGLDVVDVINDSDDMKDKYLVTDVKDKDNVKVKDVDLFGFDKSVNVGNEDEWRAL